MQALAGTWQGGGKGTYPTIEGFTYEEEVVLTRLPAKPILAYT
ncbi:MAG: heme-binding beta-barrel domain-containing protein, partial [Actinomycetota bacterium]